MTAILDLVASSFIGGWVLVSLLSFYSNVQSTALSQSLTSATDEELSTATAIIESDVRKAGYNISDPVKMIHADSTTLGFKADLDRNGTLDSVKYYLSATAGPEETNSSARELYRAVNNQAATKVLEGVTAFSAEYRDSTGNITSSLQNIRWIKLAITTGNTVGSDGQCAGICWQKTFKPMNLR